MNHEDTKDTKNPLKIEDRGWKIASPVVAILYLLFSILKGFIGVYPRSSAV